MSEKTIAIIGQVLFGIIIIFLVYKVYDFFFGKTADEKTIDKNEPLVQNVLDPGLGNIKKPTDYFTKQKALLTPAFITSITNDAYNLNNVLKNLYLTDNDESYVISMIKKQPSKWHVNQLSAKYQALGYGDLMSDIKNGLDDEPLAELYRVISVKPII